MNVEDVSAIIPTRGDVDLDEVLESFPPFAEVVVYDNGAGAVFVNRGDGTFFNDYGNMEIVGGEPVRRPHPDLMVYARYAAINWARSDVIYVQDDDAVLVPGAIEEIVAAYKPGHITANMPARFRPHYPDSCLVGFGAVFDRGLPEAAFRRFAAGHSVQARDEDEAEWIGKYFRACDVVFTTLTPRVLVDVEHVDRPFASDLNRMWKQTNHVRDRHEMLHLVRGVRDGGST